MTKYIKNEIYPSGKNLYYKTWGNHRTVFFGAFIFFIILLGAVYIYFAANMVITAVEQGANQEKFGAIEQEYRELEKQYLSLISKFSLDYAHSLGFVSAENSSAFIARTSRLSQNDL